MPISATTMSIPGTWGDRQKVEFLTHRISRLGGFGGSRYNSQIRYEFLTRKPRAKIRLTI